MTRRKPRDTSNAARERKMVTLTLGPGTVVLLDELARGRTSRGRVVDELARLATTLQPNREGTKMLKSGQYYVFFIPPGWLLAGKVESVEGKSVRLSEAAYLELTEQDTSPIADLPRAKTAAEMKRICKRSWSLEPGTELHYDGILISVPCAGDLSPITRGAAADTIRRAK